MTLTITKTRDPLKLRIEAARDGVDWMLMVLEDGELCIELSSGEELRLPPRIALGIANTITDAVVATKAEDSDNG